MGWFFFLFLFVVVRSVVGTIIRNGTKGNQLIQRNHMTASCTREDDDDLVLTDLEEEEDDDSFAVLAFPLALVVDVLVVSIAVVGLDADRIKSFAH